MAKIPLGCEPVVGSLTPSKKREYRITNRLQEGKRPLYAVVFNFIDSRYFNVFATVGGNRVCPTTFPLLLFSIFRSFSNPPSKKKTKKEKKKQIADFDS
uniref:Fertilization-independent endosperm protein n=1 Tax=Rhizophora mucronata TaxID=61149 RepID=A0A2P2LE72_RHIMU